MSPRWEDRYHDAAAMLHAAEAVANAAVFPHWLDDDRFWYRRSGEDGAEVRIVNATTGEVETVASPPVSAAEVVVAERGLLVSPNGRLAVFLRDNDLWLRELLSGDERALTTDGIERNAYARRPAAFRLMGQGSHLPELPEACWSPDSTRLFTLQTDERHVPDLVLTDYAPMGDLRPTMTVTPTSGPTDERVTEFRLVVIDIEAGTQLELRHRRLETIRMNDTIFSAGLAWWGADGRAVYFVDAERGERTVRLMEADVTTLLTRTVFVEHDRAYIDLGPNVYEPALVAPLPESGELIWYSERSGYGHLYLYDLTTGGEPRQLTSGDWQVQRLLHVDAERRDVLFLASGIVTAEGPYAAKPCLISLDRGSTRVLSDAPGDHIVWQAQPHRGLSQLMLLGEDPAGVSGVSPSGTYFIETIGTPWELPRTVLRRRSGEELALLEQGEDRGLPDAWRWPERVQLTAADGETVVHGLLFSPPATEPSASYPLIDLIYPGPQMSQVPRSAFGRGGVETDLALVEAAHLAALGAYVLLLDGRGTPGRSRDFHLSSYGAVQDSSNLEDHVAAIRQLAGRQGLIDLDRIGAAGFSAGGYAAVNAALRFGDFFKVVVAGGGNYDLRLFWNTWGDRFHGGSDPARWDAQAARSYVDGLTGKLLLIHGLLDPACHPAGMFQLVQSLIEAGKDFDLVIEPRQGHALGAHGLRKRLDFFVTHLFGGIPPAGVQITPTLDPTHARSETDRRTQ